MKDYHINIFFSDEDGGYIADIPDLQACSAFGKTAEEALEQVQVAKRAWIAAAKSARRAVPQPRYRPAIYQAAP
jgi:predicted RNase H-like HicB family nuclease